MLQTCTSSSLPPPCGEAACMEIAPCASCLYSALCEATQCSARLRRVELSAGTQSELVRGNLVVRPSPEWGRMHWRLKSTLTKKTRSGNNCLILRNKIVEGFFLPPCSDISSAPTNDSLHVTVSTALSLHLHLRQKARPPLSDVPLDIQ